MASWSDAELGILRQVYPRSGARAVHELLPGRGMRAIRMRALHMGLRCSAIGVRAALSRRPKRANWEPEPLNAESNAWITSTAECLRHVVLSNAVFGLHY